MNISGELAAKAAIMLLGIPAAVLVFLALGALIVIKGRMGYRLLMLIGCYVAAFNIIFIGDWVNLILSLAVFLVCVWFSCEGSAWKKLTLGLIMACTIVAFNGFYDNVIDILVSYYKRKWHHDLFYCMGRTLFALILYLEVRYQRPERDFELSVPLWRLMLSLAVPAVGIEIALLFFRSPFIDRGTLLADGALFLVVIFSFNGLLGALKVLEGQQRLERENALALINQNYYDSLEQQQFAVRRLRHDLSNHLQVLLTLPDIQKNGYIEEMLKTPAFAKAAVYCGDPTVNAVLAVKEEAMRAGGIRLQIKADIARELPFDRVDLCALFANGLDNAAEGCMGLAQSRREVRLKARAEKGMLAVEMRNPVSVEMVVEEELPVTTKKNAEDHGYGLKSIREAVRKYGGNMEIRRQKGEFVLFFYLLFPEE